MSDETPGNAGADTSSVPPGSSAADSNSGVTGTPAASSPPSSTASPPATVSEPSSTSSEAASGEAFDFGAMFEAPPEIPKVPAKPVEPSVVAPPTPPKPAEAPPVPPPAAPVEAPPVQPQVAQPGPTPAAAEPQAPGLDSYDPAALSNHLAANEEAAVQFTAENMFKLSPQEVEALETNMVEAVPRLMAKAFVKSQLNALSQMARIVPAMIQRQTAVLKQNADNEAKFYARWPDVKAEKHGDLVRKYAAVYRQMHPQTSLEQMVEDLGPMVMMAARVVPQMPTGAAGGQAANPVGRPAAPANGRSPPPPPFVPAGAGATNASRAPELNPIEVMFQDHG